MLVCINSIFCFVSATRTHSRSSNPATGSGRQEILLVLSKSWLAGQNSRDVNGDNDSTKEDQNRNRGYAEQGHHILQHSALFYWCRRRRWRRCKKKHPLTVVLPLYFPIIFQSPGVRESLGLSPHDLQCCCWYSVFRRGLLTVWQLFLNKMWTWNSSKQTKSKGKQGNKQTGTWGPSMIQGGTEGGRGRNEGQVRGKETGTRQTNTTKRCGHSSSVSWSLASDEILVKVKPRPTALMSGLLEPHNGSLLKN